MLLKEFLDCFVAYVITSDNECLQDGKQDVHVVIFILTPTFLFINYIRDHFKGALRKLFLCFLLH